METLAQKPAALVFDVFGTLVDFRSTIAREAALLLEKAGALPAKFDGAAFADAWRAEYQPAMQVIRTGARGYVKLDVLHAENLDRILPRFGLESLGADPRAALTHIWHRLDAWPDVTSALRMLSVHHLLAPVSNGNIALMVDMARHNHWHWDAILGADIARDYKPKPVVYRAACDAFSLPPERVMMVAAHTDDLVAAKAAGLMTAHIARPNEHGPGKGETGPAAPVDLAARDLLHLVELLES
jgi:2-haloacid dehalogenase